MSNVKILRLNNCSQSPKITLDTDKSGFRYILSQDLINNGRCLIEVVSGWSQITQQTLTNGEISSTQRIVPNNIAQIVIRSNIVQEGEDTLTGGAGQILGTMGLNNRVPGVVGVHPGTNGSNSAAFNQNEALTFVTEQLPSQIHLERLYWSDDPSTPASIPTLRPANNISLLNPPCIPFEVVLKLTFLDMN